MQLSQQIVRLSPYKACGPDGIPNILLQKLADLIEEYLIQIYQASICLKAYVEAWKEFTTIVLRKPGKPSYKVPKAYRPIVLLCTLAKVFTAIITENVMHMVEKCRLLPDNYYRGRPGRMTTDAVHVLVDKVKKAWRKGKVASILFLDIEGEFPNAITDRLLHNLRKRQIPEAYIKVIQKILEDQCTKLKFYDCISDTIHIDNGIGQGNPLSMILYIMYNADLLEIANSPEEESLSFVDDTMVLAVANNFQETVKLISDFMNWEKGSFNWSLSHNSNYEISKLAIAHFTRKRVASTNNCGQSTPLTYPKLELRGKLIKVVTSYKYLGIHVDNQLFWSTQSHKAIARATAWMLLFQRLRRLSTGLSLKHMRQLYLAVAVRATANDLVEI